MRQQHRLPHQQHQHALERLGQMQAWLTLAWTGAMTVRAMIVTIGTVQEMALELLASTSEITEGGPAVWGIWHTVSPHVRHGKG